MLTVTLSPVWVTVIGSPTPGPGLGMCPRAQYCSSCSHCWPRVLQSFAGRQTAPKHRAHNSLHFITLLTQSPGRGWAQQCCSLLENPWGHLPGAPRSTRLLHSLPGASRHAWLRQPHSLVISGWPDLSARTSSPRASVSRGPDSSQSVFAQSLS